MALFSIVLRKLKWVCSARGNGETNAWSKCRSGNTWRNVLAKRRFSRTPFAVRMFCSSLWTGLPELVRDWPWRIKTRFGLFIILMTTVGKIKLVHLHPQNRQPYSLGIEDLWPFGHSPVEVSAMQEVPNSRDNRWTDYHLETHPYMLSGFCPIVVSTQCHIVALWNNANVVCLYHFTHKVASNNHDNTWPPWPNTTVTNGFDVPLLGSSSTRATPH